jgi:chaperonin GroES
MRLKPLHDYLVVDRDTLDTVKKSDSGLLLIIDSTVGKGDRGTVLAVGPGRRKANGDLVPSQVKEGDRILFGRHSGQELKVDGQTVLVLRPEDVFAIIKD